MQLAKFFRGGITPGTVRAERAVVPDTNKDISGLRNVVVTGALTGATNLPTLGGGDQFTAMPRWPTATVAAAGNAQGNAAAITTGFTLVTAADAAKGVVLPTALAGLVAVVKNDDVANAVLKIYPASGDAINALAANAAFSIAAKTSVLLIAYDATTWYSVPLLPS